MMLTSHKITMEEHLRWFKQNSTKSPCRNLMFQYNNTPIGYIGYTAYDEINKKCSPGAYLGITDNIPIDAGLFLFYYALDYAFEILGISILETEVLKTNVKALKLDLFMGYKIIGENCFDRGNVQVESYILELRKENWNKFKETFIFKL